MKYVYRIAGLLILLVFLATVKGNSTQLPKDEDFLSLVRYLVTKEEAEIYKHYPLEEREEFIEKFWARRDPTPTTIRNEFMEQYFQKIEEANKLFKGVFNP